MKKWVIGLVGCLFLFGCEVTDDVLINNPEVPKTGQRNENIEIQEETRLVLASPTNNSKDVVGKTPVTFLWNKPIFVLKNPEKLQKWLHQNITITPSIKGSWQVLGTTGILFEPREDWKRSTRYEFKVTEKIMGEVLEYAFETPQLKLEKVIDNDLIFKNPLLVYLNQPIELSEAKKFWVEPALNFDVQYHKKEKTKNGKTVFETDKSIVKFIPQSDWLEDTEFVLHVPEGVSGLEGDLTTNKEQTKDFHSIKPFSVNIKKYNESVFDPVSICFSASVKAMDFWDHVQIDPIPEESWNEYVEKQKEALRERNDLKREMRCFSIPPLSEYWQPQKEHTVRISGDLKDRYNRALGEEKTYAFTSVFPDMVRMIHFPHEVKNYQTGVAPQYSIFYSGEVQGVRLEVEQLKQEGQTFKTKVFTKNYQWETLRDKRKVMEFDFVDIFPQMANAEGVLPVGWYQVRLAYKLPQYRSHSSLNSSFAITDFPVEMRHTAQEKFVLYPPEDTTFDVIIFQQDRHNSSTFVQKEVHENNTENLTFDAEVYPPKLMFVRQNGKVGVGSTLFQKGIVPYDAPVNFSPYQYNNKLKGVSFTDRPLFRPGDTVFFKSIFREMQFFEPQFPLKTVDPEKSFKYGVEIYDSYYEEVFSQSFETKGGSLDGKWVIPNDAKLGQYNLAISFINGGYRQGVGTNFYVTEYRKPQFLINAEFGAPKAIWKEKVPAQLSAEYAFGGALAGKKVHYTVSLFGHKKQHWYWHSGSRQDKRITSGDATLDANGKFTLPVDLDISLDDEIDWNLLNVDFTVEASPSEQSSQTISIPFYRSAEILELKRDRYFYQQKDETIVTKGKIMDLDKKSIGRKSLMAQLFQKKWVRNDRKGGDGEFVGEWKEVETEIETKQIRSDKDGTFEVEFKRPTDSGQYLVRVSSLDVKGRRTKVQNEFWVWTDRHDKYSLRQNDVNRILPLYLDKDDYQVGDRVEVLFPHDEWAIEKVRATIERGTVLEEVSADLQNNTVSFELESWMAPNVFVSVLIEGKDERGIPQIRWGVINVSVTDPDRALSIELTPEKTTYKPGDTAQVEIFTNIDGKPVQGEVTIAVVDQTLLALKARPKLELWKTFLSELPLGVQVFHSVANFVSATELQDIYEKVKNIKAAVESPFGGGGGGMDGKGGEFKPRGDFRDTAAFLASVQTDENGKATVEIPLADNLTKWHIWAVGHTNENAFGEAESELQTTLPMLISPITPNFFRAGDKTNLGLLIRRNLEGTENVKVTLQLPPGLQTESTEKTVLVRDEKRVFFPLSFPYDKAKFPLEGKEIEFRFDIEGMESGYKDAVVLTRKIVPPITSVSAAEFLKVTEPVDLTYATDERALKSTLVVKVFGTLLDRLQKFVDIAYENNYLCAEQRFSYWTTRLFQHQLFTSVGRAIEPIDRKKLEQDRDFIASAYHQAGGFKFWPTSDDRSHWFSAQVLEFAPLWEQFDVPLPEEKLKQTSRWLKEEILRPCEDINWCPTDSTRQYVAFILARDGYLSKNDLEFLVKYTDSVEAKAWFVRSVGLLKKVSPTVLAKQKECQEELQRLVKARDRYVFWEESNRSFYSQNERLTSIVFEWLLEQNLLESYHAKVVRYLAESGKNLSGNTALRILSALKSYSDEAPKDNFPANFTVKNLEENPTTGTLKTALDKVEFEKNMPAETQKTLTFDSPNKKQFYTDIELHEIFAAKDLSPIHKGFWIERSVYEINDTEYRRPVTRLKVGKTYLVRVKVVTNAAHRQVILEDTIPGGAEGVNFDLDNTDKSLQNLTKSTESGPCFGWCTPRTEHTEFYFDKTRFFVSRLEAGTHEFKYLIQARIAGEYEVLPAKVSEMYYPEVFATSEGMKVKIMK